MNEDLLRAMMEDIDPARDLTDETLDELVPHDQLMTKITAGIGNDVSVRRTVRDPIWRRVPALIGASAAALTLAIAGAVALFGSTPIVLQGTSIGTSNNVQKTTTHGPAATSTGSKYTSAGALVALVVKSNRFVKPMKFDEGVLTVLPPPVSMKTPSNARAVATRIWATSQLQGYSKAPLGAKTPLFGFGIVTITKHEVGVPVVTKIPAWVGFAYENSPYHCPAQTSGQSTRQLLEHAPSSGQAAVVVGQPSGSPAVVYVAKSVRCARLYPAELANATEEFSLPWTNVARVGKSELAIDVTPPPCGRITGNALAATWRAGSLSSVTITEYGTVPDYTAAWQACPLPNPVRRVVDLQGPITSSTRFVHPRTGPMTVVANFYK